MNEMISCTYTIISGFGQSRNPFVLLFIRLLLLITLPSTLKLNDVLAQSTEQGNINTVRQFAEAFNTGNINNVSDFLSPRYFNHESQVDPVRGQLRGPEEFIDTVRNLRIAFPDLHHEEQSIIAQGDTVVCVLNFNGTKKGNIKNKPTGENNY